MHDSYLLDMQLSSHSKQSANLLAALRAGTALALPNIACHAGGAVGI